MKSETISRSSELESTLYKCSVHGCWLTLRELVTSTGEHYRFWQCPVKIVAPAGQKGNGMIRCQTCKPCKYQIKGWNVMIANSKWAAKRPPLADSRGV